MVPLDSAHQIGLSSFLEFKNSEIEADFDYISTTRGAMVKRMAALYSAHQIGLSTSLEDVLTVVGGSSSLEFKNSEIGADFEYISTTRGAMAEQMTALDSARQIGPSTLLKDDLMVVGGSSSMVQKKA